MSQYYRYHGSLTTPPCSQAVVWTLYEVPIYISWSQVGLPSVEERSRVILPSVDDRVFVCLFISPAVDSVYVTDFLHRGGRRAGHTSAEQLQTHPPHLQPRRLHVQRRHTLGGGLLTSAQACSVGAAASCRSARRFHLQALTAGGW